MSFPNIPTVEGNINITAEQAVNLLLASIAFEELGLAHIINAEAEKIQFVLGTLTEGTNGSDGSNSVTPTIGDLLDIDNSVNNVLKTVIKKEMILQFKLENIISISTSSTTSTTSSTTSSSSSSTTSSSSSTSSTESKTTSSQTSHSSSTTEDYNI